MKADRELGKKAQLWPAGKRRFGKTTHGDDFNATGKVVEDLAMRKAGFSVWNNARGKAENF